MSNESYLTLRTNIEKMHNIRLPNVAPNILTPSRSLFYFVRCATIDPWKSNPNRFWDAAKDNFLSFWDIAKRLDGRLFIVFYNDESVAEVGSAHIKIMEVKSMDPGGISTSDDKLLTYFQFSQWLTQEATK